MTDLTSKDRENYEKLKTAFSKLNYPNNPIKDITISVNSNIQSLLKDDNSELRKRVDFVDGYLKIHALLLPNQPEDIQEIKNLNKELDRSLKVVEDETLDLIDAIESVSSDRLFLDFLPSSNLDNFKKWTEALLSDRDPNLDEKQIGRLVQAWGKSIQKFVDDARQKSESCDKVTPGKPETFASFFRIHSELETLYSSLADTDSMQRMR